MSSSKALRPAGRMRSLRIALRVLAKLRLKDHHALYVWAALIGVLGGLLAELFFAGTNFLHFLMTGHHEGHVATFEQLPSWHRIAVPTVGALLAGLTLLAAQRYIHARNTDYMEAIALGDGTVPVKGSLVRSFAAMFGISSGEAIGREGPLVQLCAMFSSLMGRFRHLAPARRRLLVACGGAAGIATAYHTPLGGAIFVAEVVLGSLAMEGLAPLMVSSILAVLTQSLFEDVGPIYEFKGVAAPSLLSYLLFPVLGLVCGTVAWLWMRSLQHSRRGFGALPMPIWLRLTLGGLLVGLLACFSPEVAGNGANVIRGLLDNHYAWELITIILILRALATLAAFGSGAVGGVFTPSLCIGAGIGALICFGLHFMPPLANLDKASFALAGMGSFLAAAAQAPVTAIMMTFEMSRRYDLVVPLAMACVVAYSTVKSLGAESIYGESLWLGPRTAFDLPLAKITVADLMRPSVNTLKLESPFRDIAASFLTGAGSTLFVTSNDGKLLGKVLLSDVEPFLKEADLAMTVIAGDVLQDENQRLKPDSTLPAAFEAFTSNSLDTLPVVDPKSGKLLGALGRADLFLILGELSRREQAHNT